MARFSSCLSLALFATCAGLTQCSSDPPFAGDGAVVDGRQKQEVSIGDTGTDLGKCKSNAECDDKLPCTTDICGVGGCNYVLNGNFCLIDKKCWPTGTVNPSNGCQKCKPVSAGKGWTNDEGKKCDDGSACSHSDKCASGICKGVPYSCDDKLICTTDTCKGTGPAPDGCSHQLKASYCLIDGACHANGANDPKSNCHKCNSSVSTASWLPVSASGCVTTLAGVGVEGLQDGPAAKAKFWSPRGLGVEASGKVYLAGMGNHRIRQVFNGQVSTLSGKGCTGTSSKCGGFADGPLGTAQFNLPHSIAVDPAGKIFVSDLGNRRIRMIVGGTVSTVAGIGKSGFLDGPVAIARMKNPHGIAVDSSGKIYFSDQGNQRIRIVSGGQVSTLAGSGVAGFADGPAATAKFDFPHGVAIDKSGNVYVGDVNNHRIRVISGGKVSTFAGTGVAGHADGSVASAKFNSPRGVAVDQSGKLYVADSGNHRIRMILNGKVVTLAGSGMGGFKNGPVATAQFKYPAGVAVDTSGKVYVADSVNYRIRLIFP